MIDVEMPVWIVISLAPRLDASSTKDLVDFTFVLIVMASIVIEG
jgi:hypothetical protein